MAIEASVEARERAYLNGISLLDCRIPGLWRAFAENFFSQEHAIPR